MTCRTFSSRFLLLVVLMAICCAVPAPGQLMQTTRVKIDASDFLVRVPLSDVMSMAVSDQAGVLALGRSSAEPQVVLHRLDAQGQPESQPMATFTLPRPAELPADRRAIPLSMIFHPRLPLLYVWQRIERPGDDAAKWDPVYAQARPLLIIRVDAAGAADAQAVELGARVDEASPIGFIALDQPARRLYVPNLRQPQQVKGEERLIPGVGYLELDDAGLVVMREGAPALHATFARVFFRDQRAGGFAPISDDCVVISGTFGPLTWNLTDANQRFQVYYTWPPRYNRRIAGHPSQPIVYQTANDESYIYCFQHVQGIVTMLPQIATANGPFGPPVVLEPQGFVAFGGINAVTFFRIAADGKFTGEHGVVAVNNPRVEAMAYSRRFQKLYVPEVKR